MNETDRLVGTKQALYYKMDSAQRAKQFAPFEALRGFDEERRKKEKENGNLEFNGQHSISVIASFNDEGNMIPLYFGFQGNRLKVDNILWSSSGRWGSKFRCEITDEDMVKTVDLIYYSEKKMWKIKV